MKPKHFVYAAALVTAITFTNGCGGGGGNDDKALTADYDGNYTLTAESTIDHTENGTRCRDAHGSMIIDYGLISGFVRTDWGYYLSLHGNVYRGGKIEGGFADGESSKATFSGQMNASGGYGTWKDDYGCKGVWQATLKN